MNKDTKKWLKRDMYIYYASFLNIPYLDFNLFDKNSDINLIEPKPHNYIMDKINDTIDNHRRNSNPIRNALVNFYLLQSYPHTDMGWILSGFLSSGKLEIGQELLWYDYDKVPVKINSIYQNNAPVKTIKGPATITITLDNSNSMNNKPRFGFLSNINYVEVKFVKVIWIYFNNSRILSENEININIKNQSIILKRANVQSKYVLKNPICGFNIINQFLFMKKITYKHLVN